MKKIIFLIFLISSSMFSSESETSCKGTGAMFVPTKYNAEWLSFISSSVFQAAGGTNCEPIIGNYSMVPSGISWSNNKNVSMIKNLKCYNSNGLVVTETFSKDNSSGLFSYGFSNTPALGFSCKVDYVESIAGVTVNENSEGCLWGYTNFVNRMSSCELGGYKLTKEREAKIPSGLNNICTALNHPYYDINGQYLGQKSANHTQYQKQNKHPDCKNQGSWTYTNPTCTDTTVTCDICQTKQTNFTTISGQWHFGGTMTPTQWRDPHPNSPSVQCTYGTEYCTGTPCPPPTPP